ncbi:MAG: hypothetical protein PHW04_03820 [Candidatus Wallbacteria bacterium]|nr:hypothetical protein [Candidatus Wallbacteria bacterium]
MKKLMPVICIALWAYLLTWVLHEGFAHGGTALMLGAKSIFLSTTYCNYENTDLNEFRNRFVALAGPLISIGTGLIFIIVFRKFNIPDPNTRFFIWLCGYLGVTTGSGYMLALSFANFGDISTFVSGFRLELLLRLAFTVIGYYVYFPAYRQAMTDLDCFLGSDPERSILAKRLLLTSYIAGAAGICLSSLLSPEGVNVLLASAIPSALGGGIWLAMGARYAHKFKAQSRTPRYLIHDRFPLYTALSLVLILYVYIGRGITI